jgi:ABC-type nitrate/sulfonate/bicarbonate transport system substrate-binding protein
MFLSWAVSSHARLRRMLAVLAVALLAMVTGCAGGGDDSTGQVGEQGSLDTVRILVNPGSNSHVPIYVAQDAGIFRENGLDV